MPRSIIFTAVEAAIVTLLFDGMDNAQIAETRGVKPDTVKRHLCVVYHKAGVHSALELVALAFKNGGYLW